MTISMTIVYPYRNVHAFIGSLLALCGMLGAATAYGGASHDWVMFRGEEGRGDYRHPDSAAAGGQVAASVAAGGEQARSFNPPVVVDDTIYFGSDDGNFYALDVHSGYMRWIFQAQAPVNSVPFARPRSPLLRLQRRPRLTPWGARPARSAGGSLPNTPCSR